MSKGPSRRPSCKKKGKNGELFSRKVLEWSVTSAHELFVAENPQAAISRAKFAELRPVDVMPTTCNRKRDCLCEYCANIELKLDAMKMFVAKYKLDCSIREKYELSRITLCPAGETGEHMRTCLERKFSNCGTSSLEEHLRPLLEAQTDADVKFDKWEKVTYSIGGVPKKRMTRSNKSVSVSDFITELVAEVEPPRRTATR